MGKPIFLAPPLAHLSLARLKEDRALPIKKHSSTNNENTQVFDPGNKKPMKFKRLLLNHSFFDGFGRGYGCSLGFGLMDGQLPIESRELWTGFGMGLAVTYIF